MEHGTYSCADGHATLRTEHGELQLPAFLPDATRAVVRTVDSADIRGCGVQGLVVNVFHLRSHPGIGVVKSLGGVHRMMQWPGVILSDSGGFQVHSLLATSSHLGSVTRRGFVYREARSKKKRILTPERAVQLQFGLGSDVLVCLDHCTHADAPPEEQRRSVRNTVRWAKECKQQFELLCEQTGRQPLLFAVVQGGGDPSLRQQCAEGLVDVGFDGYGFGGWPVTSEGWLEDMVQLVAEVVPHTSPRWAFGVGKPEHVVNAARMGYDLFDCVIPTRDARHGRLYVFAGDPDVVRLEGDDFYWNLYPLDHEYIRDPKPVDPNCDCPCCRSYSRAYLHHLFWVRETLGYRLATLHNLRFYSCLMERLRAEAGGQAG